LLWAAVAKSGASGVDLFFTLSAFLITVLLLRERRQTGGISLRLFYIRRILRIWPLYFFVLAVSVVLAHTIPGQSLPWYYAVPYLLFVGNWINVAFGHLLSVCAPLWTVSIEEQFYLVWPVLMKMWGRRGYPITERGASRQGYSMRSSRKIGNLWAAQGINSRSKTPPAPVAIEIKEVLATTVA
jgi:peptidoglycan/LPS O-acetylase OafA/YrhL